MHQKVTLYAVQTGRTDTYTDGWKWYVSLDMSVDHWYWFNQESSYTRADSTAYPSPQWIRVVPDLSLGVALFLRQKLSELHRTQSNRRRAKQARIERQTYWMERWQKCIEHNVNILHTKQMTMPSIEIQPIPMTSSSFITKPNIDLEILNALSRGLQGRALLMDELLHLFQHVQSHLPKTDDSNLDRFTEPPSRQQPAFQDSSCPSSEWRSYVQLLYLLDEIEITNGVQLMSNRQCMRIKKGVHFRCQRCGSHEKQLHWTYCITCEQPCPYCIACLNMGQSRFCALLIHGKRERIPQFNPIGMQPPHPSTSGCKRWKLSPAQTAAAEAGLRFLHDSHQRLTLTQQKQSKQPPPCYLIWAVTGAGKTEMIFPLIESELSRNGKVLLTTPRKDVVIELQPRLKTAFPQQRVVTLYGGSTERWEVGQIILATTHQLMRFRNAFDLIVIDELDAFPFHNNPMLEYAVQKACSPMGRYILLTATPPIDMQKAIRKRQIPYVLVPVRYHGYPLPIPKRISKSIFHSTLHYSLERGARVLLFVPRIKIIPELLSELRSRFPDQRIEGTSSQDPDRGDKVQQFRDGLIPILITTTILERGVTVPKVDVFIYDADHHVFDEVALVQMAGRAGRSSIDPQGNVFFIAAQKTKSQVKAIKQIFRMNRLAYKQGFLTFR